MMGHEASTLATEYGPQWMNIPNFASRYQAVLSASDCCAPGGRAASPAPFVKDTPISKAPMVSPKRKISLLA
jgi:hypothetical protein